MVSLCIKDIRNTILNFLNTERNKEPAIVPSGWMLVSNTGKWNNASYC